MTLTEFLTARLGEDEAAALACSPWPWRPNDESEIVMAADDIEVAEQHALSGPQVRADTHHIARHDPARVLREVEAKRAIVKWHEQWPVLTETAPVFDLDPPRGDLGAVTMSLSRQVAWLTQREYVERFGSEPPSAPILRHLAAVYAAHPDYDEAWRP